MGRKAIDLTGQRFGKLVVLGESEERTKDGKTQWECLCDCGNKKIVRKSNLRNGSSKSCGCLKIKDLTGKKFGKLTVINKVKERVRGNVVWKCECDCGNVTNVVGVSLTRGLSQSCGCLQVEKARETMKKVRIVLKGKDSPHYDSSIPNEERMKNRYQLGGKSVVNWRKEIFSNDDFTCQSCNQRGCKLNAHHLNSWNAFPEQRFDTGNGITLCEDCHKEFHHFNGKGNNTLEEFRDHLACLVGEEYVSEIEETLLSRESEIIGQEEVEQKETRELQTT